MPQFIITAKDPATDQLFTYHYDNLTSELKRSDGSFVFPEPEGYWPPKDQIKKHRVSKDNPDSKRTPHTIKIQLGMTCNFSCTYCSQRFVPHVEVKQSALVRQFLDSMDKWFYPGANGDGAGIKIEFWGGEPLVYWKSIKTMAEEITAKYPKVKYQIITNGSLLDLKKVDWLVKYGFTVLVSHDGPGQATRGLDPFLDPVVKESLFELRRRLPQNFSVNAMVHKNNRSRAAISDYFEKYFGEKIPHGEGSFIDVYDEGSKSLSLSKEEMFDYRKQTFEEMRGDKLPNILIVKRRVNEWLSTWKTRRPAEVMGQKCGMDRWDMMAVDLSGNVITCQNVSAISTAPNGEPHKIGHVNDLAGVRLTTATHWSYRNECVNCPVVQVCKGSCMFLDGELFNIACDNSYSDHVPFMAAAFEKVTGHVIMKIEGPHPKERHLIFGES